MNDNFNFSGAIVLYLVVMAVGLLVVGAIAAGAVFVFSGITNEDVLIQRAILASVITSVVITIAGESVRAYIRRKK